MRKELTSWDAHSMWKEVMREEIGSGRRLGVDRWMEVPYSRDIMTNTRQKRAVRVAAYPGSPTQQVSLTPHQKDMMVHGLRSGYIPSGRNGYNKLHVRSLAKLGLVTPGKEYTWEQDWHFTALGRAVAQAFKLGKDYEA